MGVNSELEENLVSTHDSILISRRYLHRIPEIGLKTHRTKNYLIKKIEGEDLPFITLGSKDTGIVATLENGEGPTTVLRADMDGLNITEDTGLDFASEHTGKMHACGHDGHMAMVLGAMYVLNGMRDQYSGTVKFLFQPGEEGYAGAKDLLDHGLLEQLGEVDAMLGLHLLMGAPEKLVLTRPGVMTARYLGFKVEINGTGGHSGFPEKCNDPGPAAANFLSHFYSVLEKHKEDIGEAVLRLTNKGVVSMQDCLPDSEYFVGGLRTFSQADEDLVIEKLTKHLEGLKDRYGVSYNLTTGYDRTEPPMFMRYLGVVNDEQVTARVMSASEQNPLVNLSEVPIIRASEDFSYYGEAGIPTCFGVVGTGNPAECSIHQPSFDFKEEALMTGVRYFCNFVLQSCRE